MMRHLLLGSVFFGLSCVGAYANGQTPSDAPTTNQTNPNTTSTDRSEDDWRKSKKKRSGSRNIDIFKSPKNYGNYQNFPPLKPIDKLPEESKRHLQKLRAEVIATLKTGETPDADTTFKPSKRAQNDAKLAKEEQDVWKLIVTDMKASASSNGKPGQGPNKIAVVGRGGAQSGSPLRGGSAASASEILAKLKGRKVGAGQASTARSAPSQSGQTPSRQRPSGSAKPDGAQGQRGGSNPSTSDIFSQIKGAANQAGPQTAAQSGANNSGSSNSGSNNSGSSNSGLNKAGHNKSAQNNAGQNGSGKAQPQDNKSGHNKSGQNNAGQTKSQKAGTEQAQKQAQSQAQKQAQKQAQNQAQSANREQQRPQMDSPLTQVQNQSGQASKCKTTSASAYIKNKHGQNKSCH